MSEPIPNEGTRRFLTGILRLLAKELPPLNWCWAHHRYDEECGCTPREQVTR